MSYRPHVDVKKLSRNTKVVAEALARVIYNLTEKVQAPNELSHWPLMPSLLCTCDMTFSFFSLPIQGHARWPWDLYWTNGKWINVCIWNKDVGLMTPSSDIFSFLKNHGKPAHWCDQWAGLPWGLAPSWPVRLSVVTFSRFRRSSSQQWWTGSRLSLVLLSCWTKTAAYSPPWSITSHITSRTWRDTTSKRTKGKQENCPKKKWLFTGQYLPH